MLPVPLSPPPSSSLHVQKVILVLAVPTRPGLLFIVRFSRVTLTWRLSAQPPDPKSVTHIPGVFFNFLWCCFNSKEGIFIQDPSGEAGRVTNDMRSKMKKTLSCEEYCHFKRPPTGIPLTSLNSLSCFFPGYPSFPWPLPTAKCCNSSRDCFFFVLWPLGLSRL